MLFWVITQQVVVASHRRFGKPIGPIFRVQGSPLQKKISFAFSWVLDPWRRDRQFVPKRRWEITTTRCVITQRNAVLLLSSSEAWNHALWNLICKNYFYNTVYSSPLTYLNQRWPLILVPNVISAWKHSKFWMSSINRRTSLVFLTLWRTSKVSKRWLQHTLHSCLCGCLECGLQQDIIKLRFPHSDANGVVLYPAVLNLTIQCRVFFKSFYIL